MPGVKTTSFKGTAPKMSPELLPESFAQIARNCKLYSGDLIPFPEPAVAGDCGQTGTTRTIYPLRNPDTDEIVWMSWATEVNVAAPAFPLSVSEQRFYYTGDGVPKVSTYDLATSGAAPFPVDYYELGLPLPSTPAMATAATYSARTISSVSRDSGGLVTFVTSTDHGLKTGMSVAIKGFTHYACTYSRAGQAVTVTLAAHGIADGSVVFLTKTSGDMTDGAYVTSAATADTFVVTDPESGATSGNLKLDTRSFNTTSAEVIVVDDTTFKCFLPGFEQATFSVTGASVELGTNTTTRTYVYTWYTHWGEESVASEPSDDLVLKEGQVVTVTDLPSAKPALPVKNFIGGIRLYRTFGGTTGADYFLLKDLWFPQALTHVARADGIATITTDDPHHLLVGDRFKISSCTDTTFNKTDGIVLSIPTARTFTFASAGTDTSTTADTTGVLFHDAAESVDDASRFWGDTNYDFTDDFNVLSLTDSLISDEWIAPPEDLAGLKVIQNNLLAGFVNNRLYISEPNNPHAWPEAHQQTIDVNIVAIEPLAGIGAIILTEKYPILLIGNDPADMQLQRIDALYPCVSSRGVVPMSYGILYPTQEGLALYSSSGPRLVTSQIYEQDTWSVALDPTTIVAGYYGDSYFAAHSTGSFIFKAGAAQEQGYFVDCDQTFTAIHNDALTNRLFFVEDSVGTVEEWDDLSQPNQTQQWKSKVLIAQDYNNIGAARIVADYEDLTITWDSTDLWEDITTLWSAATGLTFTFYADKTQIFSANVTDSGIFRLPSGYRSDTFEFEIESDIRVRAVHLGQTPLSLKEV